MVPIPKAVRVRTSNGWQDVALIGPPGPPSGVMQLIGKYDLVASNIIPNIPQNFEHLKLFVRGRCAGNGVSNVFARFNGNTGASYDYSQMYLVGGQPNAQGFAQLGQTSMKLGWATGADSVAGYKGSIETLIPGYTAADQKECISQAGCWTPAAVTVAEFYGGLITGIYRQVGAITQIQVFGDSAWAAGSTAWLYGIKADFEGLIQQNWSDIYCQVVQGTNPSTSCANGLWTQVLIPAVGASFVVTKADGINDDFTRNADGSVTINKSGNYHVEAVASEIVTAWPDAASINFGLAKANGRLPTTSDWLVVGEYTSGSATNNYPSCPVSCDVFCNAGDRIAGWLWHNSGAARNIALRNFSITRMGAGPPGPPGGQVTQIYTPTAGYTADRTFNPEASSLTEVARVLATLIDDMKLSGLIKP